MPTHKPLKHFTLTILPTNKYGETVEDFQYPQTIEKAIDIFKVKAASAGLSSQNNEPDFIVCGDKQPTETKGPLLAVQKEVTVLKNRAVRNPEWTLAKLFKEALIEADNLECSDKERENLASNHWQKRPRQDEWLEGLRITFHIEQVDRIMANAR